MMQFVLVCTKIIIIYIMLSIVWKYIHAPEDRGTFYNEEYAIPLPTLNVLVGEMKIRSASVMTASTSVEKKRFFP